MENAFFLVFTKMRLYDNIGKLWLLYQYTGSTVRGGDEF